MNDNDKRNGRQKALPPFGPGRSSPDTDLVWISVFNIVASLILTMGIGLLLAMASFIVSGCV